MKDVLQNSAKCGSIAITTMMMNSKKRTTASGLRDVRALSGFDPTDCRAIGGLLAIAFAKACGRREKWVWDVRRGDRVQHQIAKEEERRQTAMQVIWRHNHKQANHMGSSRRFVIMLLVILTIASVTVGTGAWARSELGQVPAHKGKNQVETTANQSGGDDQGMAQPLSQQEAVPTEKPTDTSGQDEARRLSLQDSLQSASGCSGTAPPGSLPGWLWPTGSNNFCGYLGWLCYNSDFHGFHLAQDMCNPRTNPVYSISDGEVVLSRTDVGGYGPNNTPGGAVVVRYQAADGTWFTVLYGHLDSPHPAGHIGKGDPVGYTNGISPSHVHVGIHPGHDPEPTNPWRGYTSAASQTYGFVDPVPFLVAHPAANAGGNVKARVVNPVPGSTLTSASVTFSWDRGSGIDQYFLYLGNAPGRNDIYGQSQGTNLSATVSGLPTDGRTLYVRLWCHFMSGWDFNDYAYVAPTISVNTKARILSPAPGSTLTSSSATFSWDRGSGIDQYFLYLGNAPGRNDMYSQSQGTNLSATVSGLPTDGRTLYVRLWSHFIFGWDFNDYTYATPSIGSVKAQIISPSPGSTFPGSTVTFVWNRGVGVDQYFLYVGNSQGNNDLYGGSQGSNLSVTLGGFPRDGRPIYVRLWSYISGSWYYNDYTYRASRS
jgi:murein DD-endopeptidase MepM/ murein hydrolase activator NlpD